MVPQVDIRSPFIKAVSAVVDWVVCRWTTSTITEISYGSAINRSQLSSFLTKFPFYACSFTSWQQVVRVTRHQGLLLSLQDISPIKIASCQSSSRFISSASGFCPSIRNLVTKDPEIIMIRVLIFWDTGVANLYKRLRLKNG